MGGPIPPDPLEYMNFVYAFRPTDPNINVMTKACIMTIDFALRDKLLAEDDHHLTRQSDTEIIMHEISREMSGAP